MFVTHILQDDIKVPEVYLERSVTFLNELQVRFIKFFINHYIPPSVSHYRKYTITAGINYQSMLKLPVKTIAENVEQLKFCELQLTLNIAVYAALH